MPWTDNQRRRACRLVFVALCLVPTAWVAWSSTRISGKTDWELQIAARSGLEVQVGAVSNPTPGLTVLNQIKLIDSIGNVGSIQEIRVHYFDRSRLELTSTRLDSAIATRLLQAIRELKANGAGWELSGHDLEVLPPQNLSCQPIQFPMWNLVVDRNTDQTWKILRLDPSKANLMGPALELQFVDPVSVNSEKKGQRIIQARSPTPGWVMSILGSEFLNTIPDAKFCGTFRTEDTDQGRFANITQSFVSEIHTQQMDSTFPSIDGTFELQIKNADWRDGKIHRANLQILGKNGSVPGNLILGLAQYFSLVSHSDAAARDSQPFAEMAVKVEIDSGVCQIKPVNQRTNAIAWTTEGHPIMEFDNSGQLQVDVEQLVRVYLEPESPGLLADDQLVEHLKHFHLPPDSRSARQPPERQLR